MCSSFTDGRIITVVYLVGIYQDTKTSSSLSRTPEIIKVRVDIYGHTDYFTWLFFFTWFLPVADFFFFVVYVA